MEKGEKNKWLEQKNIFAENEAKFLADPSNQRAWEKMYMACQVTCELSLAQRLRRTCFVMSHEMFLDTAMEAAVRIMNRYKKPKGYKITNLSNVCMFSIKDVLDTQKAMFENDVIPSGLTLKEILSESAILDEVEDDE